MTLFKKQITLFISLLIISSVFLGCNKIEASTEKIGVIAAMDEELEVLLKDMKDVSKETISGMIFYKGKLWGKDVVSVVSGVGKVNAGACTQTLATKFNVTSIINLGVAGGVGKDIYPGDVVIGDTYVQHDFDTSVFGDKIGQISRMDTYDFKADNKLVKLAEEASKEVSNINTFTGRIVSGDQFVADKEKIKWLEDYFNASAVEMESAAIAQVCHINNIPFVIIRSISDNANNGAHMDYEKFKPIAVENSTSILKAMFSKL
ncbi:5'-methylthioadenosine/adenosylhomocysteine nucleosidase [Clostridium tarantellae]|uniref:adenosylhomocysteine nucleosidase n=1 Tax=Clostridium tarantellae TaxID=39493 RepID=A0A6I1MNH7_9CLOT|nr:5'-methylthioadenosine/adenosylhomocysteine nucleosidase [Clostridium tarantellae]MPQ44313.1 5'-methylthioadenosine/adenosylhomocysteine nucleosidase [Clostridium tarantellae]